MIFKKSKEKELDVNLFKDPTSEYRAAPFWAWNCALQKEELERQIGILKEMGFGGFHMHSRTGMSTVYLSDEFMDLVKFCTEKAKERGMIACLYDEDRWPSGAAGGYVTKDNPEYRQRHLLMTEKHLESVSEHDSKYTGAPYLVACFDVVLNNRGELESYRRIDENEEALGKKKYFYVKQSPASWGANNQVYVDTMSKDAVGRFAELTYDAYYNAVGDEFGKNIHTIFCDEPSMHFKKTLGFAHSSDDAELAWTYELPELFFKTYGYRIEDHLPELFWEQKDGAVSVSRYRYFDLSAEMFARGFADTCGDWCEKRGLMLTGHVVMERDTNCQSMTTGEAMRSYRSFHLPGVDMLKCDMEYTTVKQAQSASHQYGREGVMSELYGVTNWDFDFRGHKFHGDWQAALGVTNRVPHLTWLSMGGDAKRDYPASIGPQSPWFKEYKYIEDHFARLGTALTRGKPIVKLGVIHPIESTWLHYGPQEQTYEIRKRLEDDFVALAQYLLFGLMDFDYICEALLPLQIKEIPGKFGVGEMAYDAVLVPACETLRRTTFDALKNFKQQGGRVIFAGECPKYLDAAVSEELYEFYKECICVRFDKSDILGALENERVLDIRNENGTRTQNLLYNYRNDGEVNWLFIAKGVEDACKDISYPQKTTIKIKGEFTPLLFDTLTGEIKEIAFEIKDNCTHIEHTFYSNDSILLQLRKKDRSELSIQSEDTRFTKSEHLCKLMDYKREEPNVLLLDYCSYALDDEPYGEREEILRIVDILSNRLGYCGFDQQPWLLPDIEPEHSVRMRYEVVSETELCEVSLALEHCSLSKVILNGEEVSCEKTGFYVDKAISTIALPKLICGTNILEIIQPITQRKKPEAAYLLGEFDVRVNGVCTALSKPGEKISFGDIVPQGMPFYGGNLSYFTEIELDKDCDVEITVSRYRGSLVHVILDGEKKNIVFDPYKCRFENIKSGKHKLEFKVFGNRYNTFGALHNADYSETWAGPNLWVTKDYKWSYEYIFKPFGILSSPVVRVIEK